MQSIHIKTALPGPKAQAILDRDVSVTSPSYPRDYPFVMSHGRGAEVWDVDGNRFLDFAAGIAVCSTGHSHPHVVQAIKDAADQFLHISSDYWHERQTALAERLNAINPMGEPVMSFFCQSGTEAVEGALKLARYVTGRPRFIGFLGGFHGRSMGSLAFTSSKYTQQKGFFPTMPGVTHVPYPNVYRPLLAGEDQGAAVLHYIENVLFRSSIPATEVAAIMVEPIQGEGGYLVPPDGFLKGLRELCGRHGILLIFDEVQTGFGRTGSLFVFERSGVVPDILVLGKALGGGMPMGGMAMGGMGIGGMGMMDLNDIEYDAYLANDRTLDDPEIVQVEKGGRVRLRIINGATATAFTIDTGTVVGSLAAVDGMAVEPVTGTRFPISMGQRLDIVLQLPPGPVSLPILALREGSEEQTGVILATADASISKVATKASSAGPVLDLSLESMLKAASPLDERPATKTYPLILSGSMTGYAWGISGDAMAVNPDERVRIVMRNMSMMAHPMHLHGHHFQVVGINGQRIRGAVRDTVHVPPMAEVAIEFDANNPGRWPFHCHHLYHMAAGMMSFVSYNRAI